MQVLWKDKHLNGLRRLDRLVRLFAREGAVSCDSPAQSFVLNAATQYLIGPSDHSRMHSEAAA